MTVRSLFPSSLAHRVRRFYGTAGVAALVAALGAAVPATAQTYTYTATSSTPFTTTASWSGGTIPASSTTSSIVFAGNGTAGTTAFPTHNLGALTLNNLTFASSVAGYRSTNIGGATASFVFDGTAPTIVINNANATGGITHQIQPGVTLNANTTVSITNSTNQGVTLNIGNSDGLNDGTLNGNGNTLTVIGQAGNTAAGGGFTTNLYQALSSSTNFAVVGGTGSTTGAFSGGGTVLSVNAISSTAGFTANVSLQAGATNTGNGGSASLSYGASNTLFTPVVTFVTATTGAGAAFSNLTLNGFNGTVAGLSSAGQSSQFQVRNFNFTAGQVSTLTIDNSANYSYGGQVTNGSGAQALNLVKNGTGTQTFTGTATGQINYSGSTTVNAGTLTFAGVTNNGIGGANGAITVNGGTMNVGTSSGGFSLNGATTVAGGTLNMNAGSNVNNTTATVSGGTLNVAGGTVLSTSPLTVNSGTLNVTAGGINSTTTLNGGTATLSGGAMAATTISGGSLTKTGGTLGAVNLSSGSFTVNTGTTYTNALTQTGGTFTLNGTITGVNGTVNVTGGTVQGTGTLPAFALNNTATLSPAGAGIGTISASSLVFNGGGTVAFNLDQVGGTSDRVALTGAFTKGSAGAYTFDFGNTTLNTANTFTLANFGSTDFLASDFTLTGLTAGSGINYALLVNSGNVQLTVSAAAVPESGTGILAALGLLGAVAVPVLRRRRK